MMSIIHRNRVQPSKMSFLRSLLCLSFFLPFTVACVNNKVMDEPCPVNEENKWAGKAFISFNLSTQTYQLPEDRAASSDFRGLIDAGSGSERNDLERSFRAGKDVERKISSLYVLMFSSAGDSNLKYLFKFDTSTPISDNYTEPTGGIAPLNAAGKTFVYQTSTKLVEPGDYYCLLFANPVSYAVESMGTDQYAKAEDIFKKLADDINTDNAPTYNQAKKLLDSKFISYQFLNGPRPQPTDNPDQDSNNPAVIPIRGIAKGPFNDKDDNPYGLAASTNFIISVNMPEAYSGTTKKEPLNKYVSLWRTLAKLLISIDNLQDDEVTPEKDSYNYKIKDIQLHAQDGYAITGIDFHYPELYAPVEGIRAENKLMLRPIFSHQYTYQDEAGTVKKENFSMIQPGQFPLLDRLMTEGFREGEKLVETELFNLYLPPYIQTQDGSSSPAYEPVFQPEYDINTFTYLYLLVENKKTGTLLEYKIPIHNDDVVGRQNAAQGPIPYPFPKSYKIQSNHLYHIHLRFHGKRIYRVRPNYTVKPYVGKEVNVPAFT